MKKTIIFLLLGLILHTAAFSQKKDSVTVKDSTMRVKKNDSLKIVKKDSVKKHDPRKATIRSAIIPGWGQIYNKKYWKLPLVYAAVGIPAYLIYDNKRWYDRSRYALSYLSNNNLNQDSLNKVHPKLRALVDNKATQSVINYRNEFRKNMDYSILITLLFWGLNVVDATVDAHLKEFDVSEDISLRFKPAIIPATKSLGLSMVFTIGKNAGKNSSR